MITDHFPLLGLRLRTPRLELRIPSFDDLGQLAEAAMQGVHDPDTMPFSVPWTDQPPDRLALGVVQHNLGRMASWTPKDWNLNLVVVHEGAVVGVQDMRARDFAVVRQVGTGSWLGRAHQGRGVGTEMRAAVLHLAFAELGAVAAVSTVNEGNRVSERVCERLGYQRDGIDLVEVRGKRVVQNRYRLTREGWEAHRTASVTVTGLEPCLPLLGLDGASRE
ncbi:MULTISPECIES: GNAT family N-acetyltransferase [Nocardiopsis]|uniref:GNAT family N-acetyltransferase n=1 Tax=Nocardiopsis sinuspersici TaxID=501010 RepID=A0A1V3C7G4_9ACTN|nr:MULTISPECIES: GNAT family protein [Nocardiopsis]OOC56330.1 GNAT family N-acetyltransferase [Nocardiopsis sinuspersici]